MEWFEFFQKEMEPNGVAFMFAISFESQWRDGETEWRDVERKEMRQSAFDTFFLFRPPHARPSFFSLSVLHEFSFPSCLSFYTFFLPTRLCPVSLTFTVTLRVSFTFPFNSFSLFIFKIFFLFPLYLHIFFQVWFVFFGPCITSGDLYSPLPYACRPLRFSGRKEPLGSVW